MENVIIIGGGPAGLAASIYNARAGLNPLVIAGSPPGGQLTLTTEVENYPGFESIMGPDLIVKMRKHAEKFGVRFIDQNVVKVDFSKKPFEFFLPNIGSATKFFDAVGAPTPKSAKNLLPSPLLAKSVIIATGAKALWLGLESETRLRGKGVSACATCDGFFFKDKVVGVIGGGDTAMEEALILTKFAKKVYIIHRRNEFRASKIMQDRVLKNPKIEIVWNSAVEEVLGEKKVEGVRLSSVGNEARIGNVKRETSNDTNLVTEKRLTLDGVFIAIGHKPDTDVFKNQVELDNKGYILTSDRIGLENLNIENSLKIENLKLKIPKFDAGFVYQTSVKGVFAAGDCVDHKYRQAATAVGMGVAAALESERYLENVK